MYYNLFDQYPVNGHLSHFCYVAIVNNAAVIDLVWTLFYICANIAIGKFSKVEWVAQWLSALYFDILPSCIQTDCTEMPPVGCEGACHLPTLPAQCVKVLVSGQYKHGKRYCGVVVICVCLIIDHVVSEHLRSHAHGQSRLSGVCFVSSPLCIGLNSFFSANSMKFPVDNRGPLGCQISVGFCPFIEPRNFFLGINQVKGCLQWPETPGALN